VNKTVKNSLLSLLKLLFMVGPFVWIFQKVDFQALGNAFGHFEWKLIPLIVVLLIGNMYFFQSFRWWILLRAFMPTVAYPDILTLHMKGLYYSIILPSSAAQDFVRALLLQKKDAAYDYRIIWGSTGISKLFGVLTQLMLGIIGFAIIRTSVPPTILTGLTVTGLVVILTTILFFTKRYTRGLRILLDRFIPANRIISVLKNIRQGIYLFKTKRIALLQALLVSLLMNIFGIVIASLIFRGITGRFYLFEALAFIPLIELLVISVPITPGGIGIRELLLSFFLTIYLKLTHEQTGVFVLIAFSANFLRFLGGIPVIVGLLRRLMRQSR
jgi:uncharacterized protein (TIRG00374 family)